MTGFLDRVPYRSRHPLGHGLVDKGRDKPIVCSLPHVYVPPDRRHIEGPAAIQKLTVAYQSVTSLGEAFGAGFTERSSEFRLQQDPLIVVVDGLCHLLDEGAREAFGGQAKRRIHQAKTRLEAQREKS